MLPSAGHDDAEGDLVCGEQGELSAGLPDSAGPGGLQLSLRQIQQADPAVLDTVHALGREVQNRHLPTVQDWQRVLSRVRSRRVPAGLLLVGSHRVEQRQHGVRLAFTVDVSGAVTAL